MRADRFRSLAAALALGLAPPASAQEAASVARILDERCVLCHQGDAAPLGLRLDSVDSLLKGSRKGAVVKPGDAAGSELMRRLRGQSLPRMPLTGPPFLSDADMTAIERWIAAGAPRAAAEAPGSKPARIRSPGEPPTYADVQPILGARCAKCHTDGGLRGPPPEGYRLNNYENTVSSTERARVVPGKPAASELVRRIRGQAKPRMPFDGPPYLGEEEIRLIERWIARGARDAEGRPATVSAGARVRLHGTLGADGTLDGLGFDSSGARIRAAPGGYVELRGRLGADGSVHAERVRSR